MSTRKNCNLTQWLYLDWTVDIAFSVIIPCTNVKSLLTVLQQTWVNLNIKSPIQTNAVCKMLAILFRPQMAKCKYKVI